MKKQTSKPFAYNKTRVIKGCEAFRKQIILGFTQNKFSSQGVDMFLKRQYNITREETKICESKQSAFIAHLLEFHVQTFVII